MSGLPRRLFIALPVENPGLSGAVHELERYSGFLKIVSENNYHITLKFLGNTDLERFEELAAGLDSGEIPPKAEYSLKGLGCFPGLSNPKVIWAGMEYDRECLERIFRYAEKCAISAGFPAETGNFRPHLTLARVKRDLSVPAGLKDYIKSSRDNFFSSSVSRPDFNKAFIFSIVESRMTHCSSVRLAICCWLNFDVMKFNIL